MINKITDQQIKDNGLQSIDGKHFPSNWTVEQVKAKFDQLPAYVAARLNALIDALLSKVPGSSGADKLGSAPIDGVTGTTVRQQLIDLKDQINGLLLEDVAIPDGSLTKAKFANWDDAVMSATLDNYTMPLETGSLSSTDKVIEAFGKLERAINNLSDTLNDLIVTTGDGVMAKTAENLYERIQGVLLSEIFENDGKTVKNASRAYMGYLQDTSDYSEMLATTAFVHNLRYMSKPRRSITPQNIGAERTIYSETGAQLGGRRWIIEVMESGLSNTPSLWHEVFFKVGGQPNQRINIMTGFDIDGSTAYMKGISFYLDDGGTTMKAIGWRFGNTTVEFGVGGGTIGYIYEILPSPMDPYPLPT